MCTSTERKNYAPICDGDAPGRVLTGWTVRQQSKNPMRACILAGSIAFAALATPAVLPAQAPPDGAELVRLMHDRYVAKWYTTLTFTQATQRRTAADTMVHETWYEAMKLPDGCASMSARPTA